MERECNEARELGRDASGLGVNSDVRVKKGWTSRGLDLERQLSVGRANRDTTSGTNGIGWGSAAAPKPRVEDLEGGPAERVRGGLRKELANHTGCSTFGPESNSCISRLNFPTAPDRMCNGATYEAKPGR